MVKDSTEMEEEEEEDTREENEKTLKARGREQNSWMVGWDSKKKKGKDKGEGIMSIWVEEGTTREGGNT